MCLKYDREEHIHEDQILPGPGVESEFLTSAANVLRGLGIKSCQLFAPHILMMIPQDKNLRHLVWIL